MFENAKLGKWEENLQQQLVEEMMETVCEEFGIESVEDMTQDQADRLYEFADKYEGALKNAFYGVVSIWEMGQ